jgi:hypothetical protein
VRIPAEYAYGHQPPAQNINIEGADFATQIEAVDKTRPTSCIAAAGTAQGRPWNRWLPPDSRMSTPSLARSGLAERGRTDDDGRPLTLASPNPSRLRLVTTIGLLGRPRITIRPVSRGIRADQGQGR